MQNNITLKNIIIELMHFRVAGENIPMSERTYHVMEQRIQQLEGREQVLAMTFLLFISSPTPEFSYLYDSLTLSQETSPIEVVVDVIMNSEYGLSGSYLQKVCGYFEEHVTCDEHILEWMLPFFILNMHPVLARHCVDRIQSTSLLNHQTKVVEAMEVALFEGRTTLHNLNTLAQSAFRLADSEGLSLTGLTYHSFEYVESDMFKGFFTFTTKGTFPPKELLKFKCEHPTPEKHLDTALFLRGEKKRNKLNLLLRRYSIDAIPQDELVEFASPYQSPEYFYMRVIKGHQHAIKELTRMKEESPGIAYLKA